MKQAAKRILSFVIVVCIAFIGVFATPLVATKAEGENYVKVTKAPTDWSGDYLIVYEDGKCAFNGGLTTLDAVSNTVSVTISNNTIEATDEMKAAQFTIDNSGHIKSASGYYIGQTSNANGLTSNKTTTYTNTLSLNDDGTINIVGSGEAYLRYNATSGQYRFRYFKSSTYTQQKAICLYKLQATDSTEPVAVISISGENTAKVGDTFTLAATAQNIEGTVTWASDNETVAVVDNNGNVTANAVGKATITASIGDVTAEQEITVWPVANAELTVAEALTVCEFTGTTNTTDSYSVTGIIENIDTAYSSQYDRITVTINDGTGSIMAYRMAGGNGLVVGDTIKVTGHLVNYSGNTPEFATGCSYEAIEDSADVAAIRDALNGVQAYMSLAYTYTQKTEERTLPAEATDELTRATTGIEDTNYAEWSGKTVDSDAVYAGQSAGGNDSIQLRSSNSNSGIVTTVSGGKATKITVVWNSNTASGRTLDVYGSNTAYTAATELYNSTNGTKIGSIVYGTSTELEIKGDYAYIGIRSNSGALYLTSVTITWNGGSTGGTEQVTVLSDSDFRLRCGVDASLAQIKNVDSYGILVSANGKDAKYTSDATSWNDDGDPLYVVIGLGNIISNMERLDTVFTVRAYVVVDGFTYQSEEIAEYSVATMIKYYYEKLKITEVEHLYNYLVENGLIEEEA